MFEQEEIVEVAEKIGTPPVVDNGKVVVLDEVLVINEMMRGEYA